MKQVSQIGVDVDSEELVCALQRAGQRLPLASFANTAPGNKKFIRWATRGGESGTSIHRPRRISKVGNSRLRAALYMPALVAIQHEPNVTAFYDELVAAGKSRCKPWSR
jgi:hypothetical protein